MSKWRWIIQTLRMGNEPIKKKNWTGIPREPKDMNTGANLEKGPFWRKQENVAKCGAKLRGSPEIGSD